MTGENRKVTDGKRCLISGGILLVLAVPCACGFVAADAGADIHCANVPPEISLILVNGNIRTMDPTSPRANAVAISGECIVRVGSNQEIQGLRTRETRVIDLKGRFAMPGLIDAHVHPVLGSIEAATQCLFPATADPFQIAAILKRCMQRDPGVSWIVGGRWDSAFFDKYQIDNPSRWLDEISRETAISLADDTGHNRWVNSKALELAKISRDTIIEGGEIRRNGRGEPNGLLLEAAIWPVLSAIEEHMQPSERQFLEAAVSSIEQASRFGITGIKDAGDSDDGIFAFKALADAGGLHAHVVACITVKMLEDGIGLDADRLQRLRSQYNGPNLRADCAKIFLDGVPSVARTAAMIEEYLPEQPGGRTHNGQLLLEPDVLNRLVAQLDALGLTVKVHAAGDRAVRVALDAVAHARRVNGHSGLRHEIAHAGFVHREDIPRFRQLDVVADMSPSIWYPSPITDSIISAIGDRGRRYWPLRMFLDEGIEVVAGSDWPAVVPDMNLWTGIEAMITRRHPESAHPGSLWPEQAISLEEALNIFTVSGARALRLDQSIGSIQAGKLADIIVLNHDLFAIPTDAISETRVEMTIFGGRIVFNRGDIPLHETPPQYMRGKNRP
jgi:predicted amidohydrolase YtcJ